MPVSRRGWLLGCSVLTVEIANAQQHAHAIAESANPPHLEILDPLTAADVEALTAQIIPSVDGPGAREAGVVYFIDRALSTFESDKREAYNAGMKQIQNERRKLFPQSTGIAALSPAQQIQLLHAVEKSNFFELLRTHTLWGFLGSPAYGGNRAKVGWAHIHFDDRMRFEPPFGYYDAEAGGREKP